MESKSVSKIYTLNKTTYINLRWIAILGQFLTVNIVKYVFNFEFNILIVNIVILLGVISNLVLAYFYQKNILSIEASLRKMIPSINKQRKKNVKERLNYFLDNPSEEIEKEIALQIMKQDVSEELDRIGFHIKEINKILKSNGSHGKKIDFMLQELFREANTLSVKLDNSKAKKLAINLKILVEELREQTQNIQ